VTFLLDTNVVAETRKRQPDTGVIEWIMCRC
jgi:predicted nucleic acid-binding protein